MKAIGRYLVIEKIKSHITTTKGGIMEVQGDDIRYVEGVVVCVGDDVVGIKKDDVVLYDKNAGFKTSIFKDQLVVNIKDIVVIL